LTCRAGADIESTLEAGRSPLSFLAPSKRGLFVRKATWAITWLPLLALFVQPAVAQRARFPTMIQASGQAAGTTTAPATAPGTTATATQPGWSAAGAAAAQPYAATGTAQPYTAQPYAATGTAQPYTAQPYAAAGTAQPYTAQPYAAAGTAPATPTYRQPTAPAGVSVGPPAATPPTYAAPGSNPPTFAPSYGAAPVATPGPAATFNGTILPPASWDPYAAPGMQQPSLLPQDPYIQAPSLQYPTTSGFTRFLQEVRVDYTWMDGKNSNPNHFSYHNVELTGTFALPFLYSQQNPLMVTPGFDFYFIDGQGMDNMYDAFLDTEWNPQVTPWFGGELGFRVGVYSDFQKWNDRALRFTGHGLAALTLSPSIKLKAGIVYLDRVRVKMLPAGGVVWTPNQDWRFDILFPNPRMSRRMWTTGASDWWFYARGEYGGDSWVMSSPSDQVDYNDLRVAVGVESVRRGGGNFLFEVGYSFDREMYRRLGPKTDVPDTFFLRAGLAF
jgi:hypothetical protein